MEFAEYKTLDLMGEISRGKSKHRPRNDAVLFGGEYPFIQTADIKNSGLYIRSYSQTYNETGLAQSKLWDEGTLCITIAANIADTAILGIKACFPDSIMGFVPYDEICDVRFVKYSFDILQLYCKQISKGTTQDNLSWEKLSKIKFPCPPLTVQKKIAGILSAYDDLIEVNKKRIDILEQNAKELYKEWFVRRRFPGFENAEYDFAKTKLKQITNITMGQSPDSEYYNEDFEGLPFHQGVGTYGERFPKHIIYSTAGTRYAIPNDILFSVRAPVGRLNITDKKIIIGRGLAAFNHKQGYNSYLFYMLDYSFSEKMNLGSGTVFNSITKSEIENLEFDYNEDLCCLFNEICSKIDSEIESLSKQNTSLAQMRDRLLPRLMSGELLEEA